MLIKGRVFVYVDHQFPEVHKKQFRQKRRRRSIEGRITVNVWIWCVRVHQRAKKSVGTNRQKRNFPKERVDSNNGKVSTIRR
jgi:hypothetical protein